MAETNYAWAAGFMDGEGCILIAKGRTNGTATYYSLQVSASQVDPAPLYRLRGIFGGSVCLTRPGSGNQSPIYRWVISARLAAPALVLMQPYLLVKGREARLAIRYQRYKASRGINHAGQEQPRNEWYKAALEGVKSQRKADAWAAAA